MRTVNGTTEYGVLHLEVHGQTATIETAETIPGGSRVKLTIEGVTGVGLTSALISTSSDTVPVKAGAIELAPLSGTVTFEDAAVADATVQACPIPAGTCQTTSTNGSGAFTFAVPATAGSYALTANPPGASSHAGEGKLSPVTIKGAAGATGIELALPQAPKIAPHVGMVTPGGEEQNSETNYPFVSWASPYELELEPALFPKASRILVTKVVVRGTNVASGEPEQQVVDVGGSVGGLPTGLALGSGPLTVDMPSAYPMHGEVSTTVDYRIERGHRAAAGGVASTNVLDETYPSSGSRHRSTGGLLPRLRRPRGRITRDDQDRRPRRAVLQSRATQLGRRAAHIHRLRLECRRTLPVRWLGKPAGEHRVRHRSRPASPNPASARRRAKAPGAALKSKKKKKGKKKKEAAALITTRAESSTRRPAKARCPCPARPSR